jgi:transglutaminase-like putative cysteine protease
MQLHIRHETCYAYEETVSYSIQALKLTPRFEPGQRVLSWRISAPGERLEQVDTYGNITHVVTMESPHRELRIIVEGVAEISPDDGRDRTLPALEGELSRLAFLAPTALTRPNATVREIATRHLGRHPASRATLLDLVAGIREAVEYQPGITDVSHSAAEALELGVGVCQDQAHVFVACCRAAGIPARYVSGYLYTGATGEVASHAWADAWLGDDAGWISIDVTHGAAAGAAHCRLAVGRDYLDAAPVRGVRRGGGREQLSVAVKLAAVGGAPSSQGGGHQQQ